MTTNGASPQPDESWSRVDVGGLVGGSGRAGEHGAR
jgi:hypothetical protein